MSRWVEAETVAVVARRLYSDRRPPSDEKTARARLAELRDQLNRVMGSFQIEKDKAVRAQLHAERRAFEGELRYLKVWLHELTQRENHERHKNKMTLVEKLLVMIDELVESTGVSLSDEHQDLLEAAAKFVERGEIALARRAEGGGFDDLVDD